MTSSTSSSERSLPAVALAVLGPLVVLIIGLGWLWRPADPGISASAALMDSRLAEAQPDVVIVGNSLAWEGIDANSLGEGLGGADVMHLTVAASPAPTWYAVLKNRVAASGQQPDLIVVVGTLSFFTATEVRSSMQVDGLAEQVGIDEPVISQKTYGRKVSLVPDRVRLRTADLRDAFVDRGRFSLLQAQGMDTETARATAEHASQLVFEAEGATDLSLNKRVIPVVEVVQEEESSDEIELGETYIPDLIDIAEQMGSRIVFVRAPKPASVVAKTIPRPELERDLVAYLNERGAGWVDLFDIGLPDSSFRDTKHANSRGKKVFTRELSERLNALGVGGEGPLAAAAMPVFAESVSRIGQVPALPPLDLAGATRAGPCRYRIPTKDLGHISPGRLAKAQIKGGSPLTVLQDGQPLQAVSSEDLLGEGCTGSYVHTRKEIVLSPRGDPGPLAGRNLLAALAPDATLVSDNGQKRWHWLYADTGLVFDLSDGAGGNSGQLTVQAELGLFGPLPDDAQQELAWLSVRDPAGTELSRTPFLAPEGGRPGVLLAQLTLPADAGPMDVVVLAGPDLPPACLYGLGLGEPDLAPKWIVGSSGDQVSVRLLGGEKAVATIKGDRPRAIAQPKLGKSKDPSIGKLPAPRFKAANRWAVHKASGHHQCSALIITEDGQPLSGRHEKCKTIREGDAAPGAYCHEGANLWFRSSDGTPPATNGRAYDAELDPEQRCGGAWWLYPGQTLTRQVGGRELRVMRRAAGALMLSAHAFVADDVAAPGTVELTFAVAGKVVLRRVLTAADLGAEPLRLALAEPMWLGDKKVTLSLRADDDAPPVMVVMAVLESAETDEAPSPQGGAGGG